MFDIWPYMSCSSNTLVLPFVLFESEEVVLEFVAESKPFLLLVNGMLRELRLVVVAPRDITNYRSVT